MRTLPEVTPHFVVQLLAREQRCELMSLTEGSVVAAWPGREIQLIVTNPNRIAKRERPKRSVTLAIAFGRAFVETIHSFSTWLKRFSTHSLAGIGIGKKTRRTKGEKP